MGRMYYGNATDPVTVPDAVLAHLKVVAASKLRRQESFTLTIRDSRQPDRGRTTLWLQCAIPLRFEFDCAEGERLDRDYLNELAQAAISTNGILLDVAEAEERLAPAPTLARVA